MTATTAFATCPDWCNEPHAENAARMRQQYADHVRHGDWEDTAEMRAGLVEDIAAEWRGHMARVGAAPLTAVAQPGSTAGLIYCNGEDIADAQAARAIAANLLAAADMLDQIV
jgi:hypothetical protein